MPLPKFSLGVKFNLGLIYTLFGRKELGSKGEVCVSFFKGAHWGKKFGGFFSPFGRFLLKGPTVGEIRRLCLGMYNWVL